MELSGKKALVTGSARRVGKEIALELAKKGCDIVLHYGKSETKAEETYQEIKELGSDCFKISADLQDLEAIRKIIASINEYYGELHIVVNSAASFVKKSFLEVNLSDWNKSVNTNLRSPFFIIQQTYPLLKHSSRNHKGVIVNISDLSGVFPWVNFSTHGISKAGLIHLTKIAARELAPEVRVNAILPGPILPPPGMSDEAPRWKDMINNIPLRESGSPVDIGQTVVFLAENEFITGSIFNVDGGEALIGAKNH